MFDTKTLSKSVVCLTQGCLAMHVRAQHPWPTTFDIFTTLYSINEKEIATILAPVPKLQNIRYAIRISSHHSVGSHTLEDP